MQQGGVVCLIGAIIMICAYAFAPRDSNYYLLAWLPIGIGLFRFGQGLFQYYIRR